MSHSSPIFTPPPKSPLNSQAIELEVENVVSVDSAPVMNSPLPFETQEVEDSPKSIYYFRTNSSMHCNCDNEI